MTWCRNNFSVWHIQNLLVTDTQISPGHTTQRFWHGPSHENDKLVDQWFKELYGPVYSETQTLSEYSIHQCCLPKRGDKSPNSICSDCMFYYGNGMLSISKIKNCVHMYCRLMLVFCCMFDCHYAINFVVKNCCIPVSNKAVQWTMVFVFFYKVLNEYSTQQTFLTNLSTTWL